MEKDNFNYLNSKSTELKYFFDLPWLQNVLKFELKSVQ